MSKTKEVSINFFPTCQFVVTQSYHGKLQNNMAIDIRSQDIIAPYDGVKILARGAKGTTGEWFTIKMNSGITYLFVHCIPTKNVGGTFKAGELMAKPVASTKGFASHIHLACKRLGQWVCPLTYFDRRLNISCSAAFKDKTWGTWFRYAPSNTITISQSLNVHNICQPPENIDKDKIIENLKIDLEIERANNKKVTDRSAVIDEILEKVQTQYQELEIKYQGKKSDNDKIKFMLDDSQTRLAICSVALNKANKKITDTQTTITELQKENEKLKSKNIFQKILNIFK
jgi:hypothetical protein